MLQKGGEDNLDELYENDEILHRAKEERNIVHTIKRRKANLEWSHLA
jgi:hypothetical protein